MGGRDKPLIPWRGKPMLDHILSCVPVEMPVIISANRNLSEYAKRGTVVTDEEFIADNKVQASPLVGILAGLTKSQTEWLLVTPGDSPNLPSDWWQKMFAASRSDSNVVAHDGARQQHLHLLLHESVRDGLREFLSTNQYQVYRWLQTTNLQQAKFQDSSGFVNVNEPEDLR
jgi:molybdopterin-guanine dinucleotide biosynthesis protein A